MLHYTEKEISFLKENYPKYGAEYCSNKLKRTKNSILSKTKRLNIKIDENLNSQIKRNNSLGWYEKVGDGFYNVGIEQFKKISTPEISYILGLLWSDGYVIKNEKENIIGIELIKEDLDLLKSIFFKTGDWKYYHRKRKNKKHSATLKTSNRPLVEYFISLDFDKKSYISPSKLLTKIPSQFKHYFYRGIVDGDGCFYMGEHTNIFSITSSSDQDWKYVEELFDKLHLKYNVVKKEHKNKTGKISLSSVIYVCNIKDILAIGKYIYNNYKNDNIGLERKYLKYINMDKR